MAQKTVDDIMAEKKLPVVAIDGQGLITYVNESFVKAYGWYKQDIIGQVITVIMPSHMRDAHNFGFSRFLITEQARILDKPLTLPVLCKNGTVTTAEHYITGDKRHNTWRFAATIIPVEKSNLDRR